MVDILEPLPPREIERLAGLPLLRLQAREELSLGEDRQELLILVGGKVWVYEANPQGEDLSGAYSGENLKPSGVCANSFEGAYV
jgi:hypothetical protein